MEVNRIIQSSIYSYPLNKGLNFKGRPQIVLLKQDEFIRRPVVRKSATGLLSKVKKFFNSYSENIRKTYHHKIIFALVEKELYGKNSIDSITHDLDKLVLYSLGFPKDFVTKFHRKHSEHHVESGKKLNLRSMICDNIASSPQFKPEKKYSLRDYFQKNSELQKVTGLKEALDSYNYGENLDVEQIKAESYKKYYGVKGALNAALQVVLTFLSFLSETV